MGLHLPGGFRESVHKRVGVVTSCATELNFLLDPKSQFQEECCFSSMSADNKKFSGSRVEKWMPGNAEGSVVGVVSIPCRI